MLLATSLFGDMRQRSVSMVRQRLMSTAVTFSALAASWSAVTATYPVSASQTAWVTAVTDGILPACDIRLGTCALSSHSAT